MFEEIRKLISNAAAILDCDESVVEALLLEMDWRVDDLIEVCAAQSFTACCCGLTAEVMILIDMHNKDVKTPTFQLLVAQVLQTQAWSVLSVFLHS